MSGVIPQVAALMGPCAAGHRLHPGPRRLRADGQGPRLDGARRAAPGPRRRSARTSPRRSSAARRCTTRVSGVGDLEVDSDEDCIAGDQGATCPTSRRTARRRRRCRESADPADRRDEELLDVLPESHAQAVRHVRGDPADRRRRRVVRPQAAAGRARSSPCLARMGGRPVGIVANQPHAPRRHPRQRLRRQGGALHQPLRRLRDPAPVPAGRARLHGRHQGRARRASSATARRCSTRSSRATVPKVTVVMRKAYGAGYYVMCGRAYEPDLIVAWPSAEIW